MEDAVEEGGNSEDKTDERAGSAYVKESAFGANGSAHENESAERADKRRERNEKGIAGANAVVAASEEVAELMSEENDEQSGGKRKPGEESGGFLVEEGEGAHEFVEGDRFVVGVGDGKLRPGEETGA